MKKFFILLLVIGCTRQSAREFSVTPPHREFSSQRVALTSTGIRPRPFSQGETLYVRHCADCHGWKGRGNGPLAQLLAISPPRIQPVTPWTHAAEMDVVARVLDGKDLTNPHMVRGVPANLSEENALLAHLQRLPRLSGTEIEQGKTLYDSFCVACHGIYGRGDGLLGKTLPTLPDLSDSSYLGGFSDAKIHRVIAEGQGAMPASKHVLGPQEIKAVTSFLRMLSPGFELYDRFCAPCHRPDGQPEPSAFQVSSGFSKVPGQLPTFDQQYFRTHSQEHIRSWLRHMLKENRRTMPHFAGSLDATAVRQVLNYVRTLSQ